MSKTPATETMILEQIPLAARRASPRRVLRVEAVVNPEII